MGVIESCSVFGHSEIKVTPKLKKDLICVFEQLINDGCSIFYFGGFGLFDELCHEVISELKNKYVHIKRIYCLSNPSHINAIKRPRWLKSADYEQFIYLDLEFDWWYQRIYFRNCAMIDRSDVIVFYVENKSNSGAYKAYQYALKKKKKTINLFN